jgi:hypothetical protein
MGSEPKEAAAPVGAGVRSLMRGHNPPAPVTAPVSSTPSTPSISAAPKPLIPRWYLFAGDVLLVALAVATIIKSPHPLSWPRELFCAGLVILAAVLAVLALLMPDGKVASPPDKP